MRLLVVGSSYAPEETGIAPYTTGLAEHMVGRGHDVTVITGMPSYPQWRVYPEYRGLLRKRERCGGVEVRRIRGYVPHRQSTIRRGLFEASFLLGGLTQLAMPRPDVVLGVVPALGGGVLAGLAARRFSRPYGLVFQDLTAPAAAQSGIAGGGRAVRPVSLPQDAVVCLHAGNMGYKQGLDNVVECARLAAGAGADPRLLFVLMGDGNQRPLLVKLAQRHRLQNLRFLPIQPAKSFSSVLAAADVLLVNQRASVTNMSLPGKLTSYFASGRPVVAAVASESETAREMLDTGTGVVVPPDQPGLLLDAVRELLADPARQDRFGAAGRRYAHTTLGAEQALAELEALVEAAAAPQLERRRASA